MDNVSSNCSNLGKAVSDICIAREAIPSAMLRALPVPGFGIPSVGFPSPSMALDKEFSKNPSIAKVWEETSFTAHWWHLLGISHSVGFRSASPVINLFDDSATIARTVLGSLRVNIFLVASLFSPDHQVPLFPLH